MARSNGRHLKNWLLCLSGLLATVICLVTIQSLFARSVPDPEKGESGVATLAAALKNYPDNYRILLLEDFSQKRPWLDRGNSSPLTRVSFIRKHPPSDVYEEEERLIEEYAYPGSDARYSMMVYTDFRVKGQDALTLKPRHTVPVQGHLLNLSLWIHSPAYLHSLDFLFRNARGEEVVVSAGAMDRSGWRRLDLTLPSSLRVRGHRAGQEYTHYFEGIRVKSNVHEKSDEISFLLNHLLILTDVTPLKYPGREYREPW